MPGIVLSTSYMCLIYPHNEIESIIIPIVHVQKLNLVEG